MQNINRLFFLFTFLLLAGIGFSQKNLPANDLSKENTANNEYLPLPTGYIGIKLGMSIKAVEDLLFADSEFLYRGAPDVTLLPQTERKVIDCEGRFYIEHAYFQFENEKLYVITLTLNTENVDYFSIFDALTQKYGPSDYLDPKKTIWRNENIELILEKPLVVKYIDKKVFNKLKETGNNKESNLTKARRNFINNF